MMPGTRLSWPSPAERSRSELLDMRSLIELRHRRVVESACCGTHTAMMTQRSEVSTIRFEATLYTIDKWTVLRVPEKASDKLPSREQIAVQGTIDGRAFRTVLEPDGCGGHWIRVDEGLQQAFSFASGGSKPVSSRGLPKTTSY